MTAVASATAAPTAKKKFRFKLIGGAHSEGIGTERPRQIKVYKVGDIIESDRDLSLLNPRDKSGKVVESMVRFVRVYDDGSTDYSGPLIPVKSEMDQRDDENDSDYETRLLKKAQEIADRKKAKEQQLEELAKMSVAQLRKYAEAEEIDLEGETNKDNILKIINAAKK